ncbi:unnamed protein product [Fraxinus pennsylvanica]|uniref:non-specific serine/threonine protein kinase n=1 Tax=Fraxinus pennsylvanica TaxID=56036 RepID=A0AAD1ZH74_9LAMI|nr:unnamed protein product [Fraxinus pennsylvanica]
MGSDLNEELSNNTLLFDLKVWEVVGIIIGLVIVAILFALTHYLISQKKSRRSLDKLPLSQIPNVSKEIKKVRVEQVSANEFVQCDGILLAIHDKSSDNESDKFLVYMEMPKVKNEDNSSRSGSCRRVDRDCYEFSHLGWGHWFTLRDLELVTNIFSKEYVIGEGGYEVVYHGQLINGTLVAIKKLLNNLGQAEKEFRVEVEAIDHVNNGNLEQSLHEAMRHHRFLPWEARMKVFISMTEALAYLHEAIEPKVVHRDIKFSNILIDEDFNAKAFKEKDCTILVADVDS